MAEFDREGLFFDPTIIRNCIAAIEAGHLLLCGPPGTGKTSLAKLLPQVFFNQGTEILTETEAKRSWTAVDVLGTEWLDGETIIPKPGIFTQAALRCVERGGRHWLFIDELNRADTDGAFSGILSTLDPSAKTNTLHVPGLKHGIKVPASFRLICAMNDSDSQFLFRISSAVLDRFTRIRIPPPSAAVERKIVQRTLFRDDLHGKTQQLTNRLHDGRPVGEILEQALTDYLETLERMREIGRKCACPELEVGVRGTLRIFSSLAAQLYNRALNIPEFVDVALCEHIVQNQLRTAPVEAMMELLHQRIFQDKYPKTHEFLSVEANRQGYFTI